MSPEAPAAGGSSTQTPSIEAPATETPTEASASNDAVAAPPSDGGAPTAAALEGGVVVPRDWQRVEVDGLSVPMPLGVEQRRDGSTLELFTREEEATYSVRVLPPPAQPITQNNATGATLRVLGRCTRALRVSDIIERPGYFSGSFSSMCTDGFRRRGRLIATADNLFVLSVAARPGVEPVTDAFLYGAELAR